jgi:uncharacterized small protein (DUF1192 family)
MSKRALLIGCNYSGANALYGCINDVIQMKGLLIDVYGFDPASIVTLRDDDPSNMPKKERIVRELQALVTANPANLFLMYSGHGSQVGDTNRDESDGRDEVIVPSDLQVIKDDELNALLAPYKGTGIALFDCCHSGTILDFRFNGVNATNTATTAGGLICFGGCQDNDLAAETFSDVAGLPQGAATTALISVLRRLKYFPPVDALWAAVKVELRGNGFSQVPQLSSAVEVTKTTPFPFSNPMADKDSQIAALTAQVARLTATAATAPATVPVATVPVAAVPVAAVPVPVSTGPSVADLQKQIATLQSEKTQSATQIATLTTANTQIPVLQRQVATLTAANGRIPTLEAQVRTLTVQAAQVPVLQRQVRDQQTLLGQIPVLKASIARLQSQLQVAQRSVVAAAGTGTGAGAKK